MATQTLCAMDEFDDLVIEDLIHGSHWAPPTDVFVCWAEAPFTADADEVRRLARCAA
jgi:hypothetical protein